jgi:hypothetical protein
VDALDINVEGHDFQVLKGAPQLLQSGGVKLLKIEFELIGVWEGQGWLGDIDRLLREYGYALVGMEIERARPVKAQRYFHRGEPLWGKALYAPSPERWHDMLQRHESGSAKNSLEQTLAKGAALYVAADLPGQALDLVELAVPHATCEALQPHNIRTALDFSYQWAKLEYGVGELLHLMRRAVGMRSIGSEA